MKRLVILGAGTAGTMMANKLHHKLPKNEWEITIVDKDENHYYQPGFLFIPFGIYDPKKVIKPKRHFFPDGVEVAMSPIDRVDPKENKVYLENKTTLDYDYLIIATGTEIRPDETEDMLGPLWYKQIFDFYTYEGTTKLAQFLDQWEGGRMVINIVEMPIKCPVAPLEFAFLADWYFTKKGMRNKVEIDYVTPMSAAFTKPLAAERFGDFLSKKGINLVTDYSIGSVDNEAKEIVSWDERRVPFDLLVTIPLNMGNEWVARSGLGNDLNFIPTDKHTLQSRDYENIFVIGDATDLPASKAGSVAHFEGEILEENFLAAIAGKPMPASFDGHANCYIETGFGQAIMIDFNYDTEPLPGKFPLAGIGPFTLLDESRINHLGKMMFRWIYWNILLKGRSMPIPAHMSMTGKKPVEPTDKPDESSGKKEQNELITIEN